MNSATRLLNKTLLCAVPIKMYPFCFICGYNVNNANLKIVQDLFCLVLLDMQVNIIMYFYRLIKIELNIRIPITIT